VLRRALLRRRAQGLRKSQTIHIASSDSTVPESCLSLLAHKTPLQTAVPAAFTSAACRRMWWCRLQQ
jgi:hypothetical protein